MVGPGIGLLLPCNVVVTEDELFHRVVTIVDPRTLVEVLPEPGALGTPCRRLTIACLVSRMV